MQTESNMFISNNLKKHDIHCLRKAFLKQLLGSYIKARFSQANTHSWDAPYFVVPVKIKKASCVFIWTKSLITKSFKAPASLALSVYTVSVMSISLHLKATKDGCGMSDLTTLLHVHVKNI